MTEPLIGLRRRLKLRHRFGRLRWLCGRSLEALRYASVRPDTGLEFHIVSAGRNAGDAAVACLQSVYDQNWPRGQVRHVYIDDASTDDTDAQLRMWLDSHADHNVDYIHNTVRRGGAANNLLGIERSKPDAIVAELNGDDWFPDSRVLDFLARVYTDPAVWKTYNTPALADGPLPGTRAIPARVVRDNTYRDVGWYSSALHTFRRRLYDHVEPQTMIDPTTGELWESADDQALYLAMLELAGSHARHLYRITYFYNFNESSEHNVDRASQCDRNERIRRLTPYPRLARL